MCDTCGSDTGDAGPCDNCSMTHAARNKEKDMLAVAAAIKKGHRQTEAAVLVENALRWCGNILTEVGGNHGEHVDKDTREALRAAIAAVHEASHIARKRGGGGCTEGR